MCGLAGLVGLREHRRDELLELIDRMTATIEHRGPDDHGAWADAE